MMHYVKEQSIILEQISEEEKTTIKQLIDTETVKIVCKALHNEAPKYLNELFHRLSDIQNRELRNSRNRGVHETSVSWPSSDKR